MFYPKKNCRQRGSTGPGGGGSHVSPLFDSAVIGGSPAPSELIQAIIKKLNARELVVSGGRSWGYGWVTGQDRDENRWTKVGISPGKISREDPLGPPSFQKSDVRKCNLTSSAAGES